MPDIIQENKEHFAALVQSVTKFHKIEAKIENDKELCIKITDFLAKNANEINKFHTIENEIIDFLQNFSFANTLDFTPVRDKLLPLQTIRLKLVKMGAEASKLVGKPDRYNCHRAINVCKQLAIFCSEKMKSADYGRVTSVLEKNIQALTQIQQEFETEDRILKDIQAVINKNAAVLNKFVAFKSELEQYAATFPHNRDTDLKEVEQRIAGLFDVDKETEKIIKLIAQIRNYADRFKKKSVQQQAESILSTAYAQMRFSNINTIKSKLSNILSSINYIVTAFNKEQKDTVAFRNRLQTLPHNIWKEDNEQIISDLNRIIKKGTEKEDFSLQSFHTRVQTAINKRTQDISDIEQKHRWLRRSCYTYELNNLKTKYMKYSDFQSGIEAIRLNRGLFTKLFELIFYH